MTPQHLLRAVVFDWAGTVVDHGSLAPMGVFVEAFQEFGVAISYSFDGTYNNRLILDYSNITMGSGGRAPDRFPFENLPGFGLDLVENRFNVQYQFYF